MPDEPEVMPDEPEPADEPEVMPDEPLRVAFFGFAAANGFAQATWAGVQEGAAAIGAEVEFLRPGVRRQHPDLTDTRRHHRRRLGCVS